MLPLDSDVSPYNLHATWHSSRPKEPLIHAMLTRTHIDTTLYNHNCLYFYRCAYGCHSFINSLLWLNSVDSDVSPYPHTYMLLATKEGPLIDLQPTITYPLSIILCALSLGLAQQENASFWCCPFISFARNKQMNWVSTRSNVPPKSCTWRGSNGGPWR